MAKVACCGSLIVFFICFVLSIILLSLTCWYEQFFMQSSGVSQFLCECSVFYHLQC
uniref:Uncharacterized protein n=1 Tax=Rhizophora mucronata TaxID=61149 RepID=A0A2P2MZY2_RHIMU